MDLKRLSNLESSFHENRLRQSWVWCVLQIHQQPEVNYLPHFSPQLVYLE